MKIGTNFARKASRGGLVMNHLEQIRILNATMVQIILNLPMPERGRKDNSKKKTYQELKISKAHSLLRLNKRMV